MSTAHPEGLSAIERSATLARGVVPPAARIDDHTLVIPVPFPERPRLAYTLAYAITDADGGTHLLDPGCAGAQTMETIEDAMGAFGLGPVRSVVATHAHPDHLPAADALRRRDGAVVALHPAEADSADYHANSPFHSPDLDDWGVPDDARDALPPLAGSGSPADIVSPDVLLEDGDLLDIPGRRIRVLHTPGHSAGHICLIDEESRALFTGDHVLPIIHPGIGLGGRFPDNPVRMMLRSLHRVRDLEVDEVRPGHEYRFGGLRERVDQLIRHHERRADEVAGAMESSPGATPWQIASGLTWTAGWESLRTEPFVYSAIAQVRMHMDYVSSGRLNG